MVVQLLEDEFFRENDDTIIFVVLVKLVIIARPSLGLHGSKKQYQSYQCSESSHNGYMIPQTAHCRGKSVIISLAGEGLVLKASSSQDSLLWPISAIASCPQGQWRLVDFYLAEEIGYFKSCSFWCIGTV